jgi:hypothetical protein
MFLKNAACEKPVSRPVLNIREFVCSDFKLLLGTK